MVQHRKQPGGVDTHQPVGLGPAEGRLVQPVIVRAGAQVCKASRMAESSMLEIHSRFMGFWQPARQ